MRRTLPGLVHGALQRLLELNVRASQHLMGIGTGSHAGWSGEGRLIREVRRRAVPGRALCVFDVGANRGQFVGIVRTGLAGTDYRVHAFEPSGDAFRALAEAVAGDPRVTANPFGLGRERGVFDLFSDAPGSGLASLSRRRLDHFGIDHSRRESVRIETLDDYCREREVGEIDLLKIDVEGHELDVLRGGEGTLRDRKVRLVSFEFGGCNIDTRTFFQDYHYFFRECGLGRIYRLTPFGGVVEIRGYREVHEQFRTTNFLAVRDDA